MRKIIITLLLLFFPFIIFAAEPVYLSGLLIQPAKNASRFTFILSAKTVGRVKYIPQPDRVEVEFKNTYKNFEMQNARLGGANVTSINAQEIEKGLILFTFYVRGEAQWKIQFLPEVEGSGTRLQLTIITNSTNKINNTTNSSASAPSQELNKNTIQPIQKMKSLNSSQLKKSLHLQQSFQTGALNTFSTLKKELDDRRTKQEEWVDRLQERQQESRFTKKNQQTFVVVIDAGHGGKDPGASGKNGAREKDIVLSIAKRLAKKMNEYPHIHAVLTRNGDYFVPLRKRLKFAREEKADLFVAIHADAYFENDATGASVYALSQHGATNEAVRWLAQRENYSELSGVELDSLSDRDPMLRSVLVDLAQTTTMQDSIRLGNKMLDALEQVTPLHYTHVERAPFVVLKSPDIPSILVETGFITNPKEEKRLTDIAYQERLANALSAGIKQYVQQYAAKGE